MYASCVVEYPVKSLDKLFTYKVPDGLIGKIKVGMKVKVPFGKSIVHGIVLDIKDKYDDIYDIKEIKEIEDEYFVLNKELLELGKYLKELTLCNLITAYQTMLPVGLKIKEKKSKYIKYERWVYLNKDEREILNYIEKHKGKKCEILDRLLNRKEVKASEFDAAALRELVKIELVKIKDIEASGEKDININEYKFIPNDEQQKVIDTIRDARGVFKPFLLFGVTGSGKTLCYVKIIKEMLKYGKTALVLVPEISLTEQVINIFYDNFGRDVAILHSGLSGGEKFREYKRIIDKRVRIVVGTRSAIFAPLDNIGIIIIDEEHSESYKQDNNPRYHARDIAIRRCGYHKCPLVLGSATPSLDSMARAANKVYTLLILKNRALNQKLPEIKIVDMGSEARKRNFIISEELDNNIKRVLDRGEQVILLLNRRGFSTVITCSNCGFTYKCPNCEISLTYHKSSNNLRCHYCGYTKFKDSLCPSCGEDGLKFLGMGTEKLESIISEKYPTAKVLRMDADTTSRKGMHEKIIKSFRNAEYNILIGTQMISKGLDFPNCTLVGVINADTTLNIPDFRSSERTFSLLDQASGRAGRGEKSGVVIIQTFNPDNLTIKSVEKHSYLEFYKREMAIRKKLKYPPYYYLVNIKVCSKDYEKAGASANEVASYLREKLNNDNILGPSTALNFKLKNIYRFNITIKYRNEDNLKVIIKEIENIYALKKDIYLEIDFNPLFM